jgi:GxxExxY protein
MISLHSDVTERIVGCLITVHRVLGPGLAERSCQTASALEFAACGLQFAREPRYTVTYRGVVIGDHRPDFVVEGKVVVELKCVSNLDPVFSAQMITYLRVTQLKVGLLVNFNVPVLKDGIRRFVL